MCPYDASLSPVRILLLEDSGADAVLLKHALADGGVSFTLHHVDTCAAFIAALAEFHPDLVISDYRLRGFDGSAALEIVRKGYPEVPVIVVSGALGDEQAVALIKAGARDYVLKDRLARLGPAVKQALADERERRGRMQAQASLRESDERYRLLATASSEIVWTADPQGKTFSIISGFEKFTGLTEASARRLPWIKLVHPDDQVGAAERWAHAVASEGRYESEFRIRNADGEWRHMIARGAPRRGELGQIKEWVGMLADISDPKRKEENLHRFRAAMEISADGIFLVDRASMRYVDVNATACAMLGYSRDELLRMGPHDVNQQTREQFEHDYDEVIAGSTTQVLLSSLRRKDGTLLPIESHRRAVLSQGGWTIVGICRDITERLAAEKALQESEEGFRTLAESMPQIVWTCGADGLNTYLNQKWVEYTGLSLAASNGQGWRKAVHPDDRQRAWEEWTRANNSADLYDLECRVRRRDDTYRWMLIRGLPVRDATGLIARWFGTCTDIDDQKSAAEALRRYVTQQSLIAAFSLTALGTIDVDRLMNEALALIAQGLDVKLCKILQLSDDGRSLTLKSGLGWAEGWIGRSVGDVEDDTQNRGVLASGEPVIIHDFCTETRFKASHMLKIHNVRSGVDVAISGGGKPYGVLGAYSCEQRSFTPANINFLQSIASVLATTINRKASEQRLAYLAQFDPLTDLPNRSLFVDRLSQILAQAERNHWLVGVVLADLDQFNIVNDTLGHSVGDELLMQVARRLQECAGSGGMIGRLAGDEFAFVLSDMDSIDDAALFARKVKVSLSTPFTVGRRELYVSASFGIAVYPEDGVDGGILLQNADAAIHRAKAQGRNTFQFYLPHMNDQAVERLHLETDLRVALERGEFLLHYQPKVELQSGTITGFEALLRWRHPARGLVPPLAFIPLLEDNGLIIPVGEWIVRAVCEQILRWQADGLSARPVAVNLSARQLQQKGFESVIEKIISDTGVDSALLDFELTESMLMTDSEAAIRSLKVLKTYGGRISVDDFGTGYSSLAYLRRFPLDALKIDRVFVRDVTTNPDDASIPLAIISLAHSLKMKVIAEGVETEAQLTFLKAHGCDEMQGYYFSPPLAAADATAALAEDRRLQLPSDRNVVKA